MTSNNEFSPASPSRETSLPPETKAARETEYELAQKAARGDIGAFEEIYWKYHRRVFSICVRMAKNTFEAEDVAQLVFIQLFSKIGSFRGDSAFSTWLHRLTVNQMLMHFRSRKSYKEQTTEDGETPENDFAYGRNSETENQLINSFELSKAIEQLPKGYRRALILHDIQGFDHEEIARMLDCATGTSKSQLHKARKKLRALLMTETAISI